MANVDFSKREYDNAFKIPEIADPAAFHSGPSKNATIYRDFVLRNFHNCNTDDHSKTLGNLSNYRPRINREGRGDLRTDTKAKRLQDSTNAKNVLDNLQPM